MEFTQKLLTRSTISSNTIRNNSVDILKKYTIYVHCWKIYNLFVQALEMGINASLW
jgi:hypothetical protein